MCWNSKNYDGPPQIVKKVPLKEEPGKGIPVSNAPAMNISKRVPTRKFLDTILKSKELSQALESFLESEFCLENLVFIQKTGKYREDFNENDMDNPQTRIQQQKAREDIVNEFMLSTSETEVNIPAKIKKICFENVEKLKANGLTISKEEYQAAAEKIFEASEQHVKTVLVQERIGRFQQTEGFAKVASNVGLEPAH